ncbi:MAG: CPBP family glutamic-type intramembrane protease, partial [Methanothermobacter sp.]
MERDQINPRIILILTAIAFSLWHFPLFFMDTNFVWSMLPFYLTGGVVGGLTFGLLRYISGSIHCILFFTCTMEYRSLHT